MKTITVASTNPAKVEAVSRGFRGAFPAKHFTIAALSVPPKVGPQPRTDAETLRGALDRVQAIVQAKPSSNFWVGIEGGVQDDGKSMFAFAWVVIKTTTRLSKSRTGTFMLPTEIADLVRSGEELGDAVDKVFGRKNSKQAEGAVGLLTGGALDRISLYSHSVTLALSPFTSYYLNDQK